MKYHGTTMSVLNFVVCLLLSPDVASSVSREIVLGGFLKAKISFYSCKYTSILVLVL